MLPRAALDHDQAQLVTLTGRRFVETGELAVGEQEYLVAKRVLDARIAIARRKLEGPGDTGQDAPITGSHRLAEALAKGNGLAYQRGTVARPDRAHRGGQGTV